MVVVAVAVVVGAVVVVGVAVVVAVVVAVGMTTSASYRDAIAAHKQNRPADAEHICLNILAGNSRDVNALHLLGCIYVYAGRAWDARPYLERALSLARFNPEIIFNLGCCYMQTYHFPDALQHFRSVIALTPKNANAWNNAGYCLNMMDRLDEAEAHYRKVVEIEPGFVEAWCNLANLLKDTARFDEALSVYAHAATVNPRFSTVYRGQALTLTYPDNLTLEDRFARMKGLGDLMTRGIKQLHPWARSGHDKIRVGWHSSDLYLTHPVARNLSPFFGELRDREAFDYYLYIDIKKPDATTEWFKGRADHARETLGWQDKKLAEQIQRDEIDVMIYLAGRYDDNRPQVAAYRPAPVNVSMFDVATSGVPGMDYFVVDEKMVSGKELFTEKLLKLPNVYIHDPIPLAPEVAPPPRDKNGYVTFGCFNNPIKIGPRTLALWKRVLEAVPTSRLMLHYKAVYGLTGVQKRILDGLSGIDPARVIFSTKDVVGVSHLSRYDEIDIALDPFPVNGSTTTFEALHQGVPVLTMRGDTVTGMWSASLVKRVLGTFAIDEEHYVLIAKWWADSLKGFDRSDIRKALIESAICQPAQTVKDFEAALKALAGR